MTISCLDCGFVFNDNDHNNPCPKCGSHNRSLKLTDKITSYELLKLGKKGTNSRKHKHMFDQDILAGDRVGRDGKLISIKQIIDREHDTYKKVIKDEHGQIIIQKEEKLSEHR
jgi:predicted  nucleic acid-binding Zn-ribbon protein